MRHGKVTPQIAQGLLALKQRIAAAGVPASKRDESFNLATWNIREFGRKPRSQTAIHYIAEIINQFDLLSLVELREDLGDLQRVMQLLGPTWRVVYSGVVPDRGGNGERCAFLYDHRVMVFNGLAAMAMPARTRVGDEYLLLDRLWWRMPYMASFRAGSFDFVVIAVHIRWGKSLGDRQQELALLARWLADFRTSAQAIDPDLIVLGDFNLPDRAGPLFQALTAHGLQVPRAMQGQTFGSNLARNKHYDQILQYPSASYPESFADCGGVLDFHLSEAQIPELFPPDAFGRLTLPRYTYELSDHLPLWIQVRCDNDAAWLEQRIQAQNT